MKKTLSALLLSGLVFSAQAAPTIYFAEDTSTTQTVAGSLSSVARSNFLAGLTGVGNENFENYTLGSTAPLSLTFPGAITATLTGAGVLDNNASQGSGGSNPGRWATSGTQFWEVSSGGAFGIALASPIAAFGFYGTDIGDFDNQLIIDLTDTNGDITSLTVNHSLGLDNNANSLLFWGFIDTTTTYTNILFRNAGSGGDTFAFDDMVVGSLDQVCTGARCNVPEPGSLALLALGLAGIRVVCRRKQLKES